MRYYPLHTSERNEEPFERQGEMGRSRRDKCSHLALWIGICAALAAGLDHLTLMRTLDEATLHSRAFGSAMYGGSSRKSSCRSRPVICVPSSSSPHAAFD